MPRIRLSISKQMSSALIKQPRFKPFRDVMIPIISVPCRSCGAEAGTGCITATGERTKSSCHRGRRRDAIIKRSQLKEEQA